MDYAESYLNASGLILSSGPDARRPPRPWSAISSSENAFGYALDARGRPADSQLASLHSAIDNRWEAYSGYWYPKNRDLHATLHGLSRRTMAAIKTYGLTKTLPQSAGCPVATIPRSTAWTHEKSFMNNVAKLICTLNLPISSSSFGLVAINPLLTEFNLH